MTILSLGNYDFPARDALSNFPAPLLFIGWDDHLMFCSPVCLCLPADMSFATLQTEVLANTYGSHPDFEKIDWDQVKWLKSGQPWTPDLSKSLAENGLQHKDMLRLQTPGLTGINGSFS